MKLQVFGVMILEKDLTEKLMKAHSVDDTLHRKDISYVGEIQRGDRLYKLYVSPSQNSEEDKYFYQVFILRDGRRLTEYEAIFGKKEKKKLEEKMIHSLKCRADFAVRMDAKGKEVLETSRSTVLVPVVRWNKKGIKWFDDEQLVKEAKC